ncbi:DUF58 domain-containing protein [Maribacter halichondriae]|uniref:DUF58 domain-containing protein n=1 Tax=Maribacter halichondriae TaxID=2980554 RepID=UPI002358F584|nr:DUF58 domain-containing protein [Maribacter sp. Hal144]
MKDYHQLLRPETINSVSGLSLIARVIVDGYLSGLNQSRRVGSGLEFSQYRGYEPGDDMRLLDWKMLARSGRYYIKQSEIETHIAVKFILDSSKSMLHEEDGLSKLDFVKVLVASLSYLSQKQGDAVGLFSVNDQKLFSLNPTVQKQQFKRMLHELIQVNARGKWPDNPAILDKLHDRSHKELIFFITDLYEHHNELTEMIRGLKTSRNEVVVLHIMGKNELEFGYNGPAIFEDLETGERIRVDARTMKSKYQDTLNAMISDTKELLFSNGIGYHLFNLSEPIENALQIFLKQRARLM